MGQQVAHNLVMPVISPLIQAIIQRSVLELAARNYRQPGANIFDQELVTLKNQISQLTTLKEKYLEGFTECPPDLRPTFYAKIQDYQTNIDSLSKKVSEMQQQEPTDEYVRRIMQEWDNLESHLSGNDWRKQRSLIKSAIGKMVVHCVGDNAHRRALALYCEPSLPGQNTAMYITYQTNGQTIELPRSNPLYQQPDLALTDESAEQVAAVVTDFMTKHAGDPPISVRFTGSIHTGSSLASAAVAGTELFSALMGT